MNGRRAFRNDPTTLSCCTNFTQLWKLPSGFLIWGPPSFSGQFCRDGRAVRYVRRLPRDRPPRYRLHGSAGQQVHDTCSRHRGNLGQLRASTCGKKLPCYSVHDAQYPCFGRELTSSYRLSLSTGDVLKEERNMLSDRISVLLVRYREFQNQAEVRAAITNYIDQFSTFITGNACIKHSTIEVQKNLNCRQVNLSLDVRYTVGYITLLLQMHHPRCK